ncbi:hypothetical protein ACIBEJ_02850 [Nonomuraea sp. NPDC050790]|uniref:hypothetical protein n=1 Tax=Nonomuraea sp. NPDC050790 TaxID=3364371 RepID=UPI0037AB3A7C
MITAVRTFAAAALATVTVAATVPAANASSDTWLCATGSRTVISDTYSIVGGQGCTGQGSGDAVITLLSGPDAGSYYCYNTVVNGTNVAGFGC